MNSSVYQVTKEENLQLAVVEMLFDFFQSLALGLRQEDCGGDEVDDGAGGESEEHGRVAVLADRGQKHGGNGCRDSLINQESDAHAVGANSGGHQFRKRQPDADSGTNRKKCHKDEEADRHQPAILRTRDRSNQGVVNFQRSIARNLEVGKRIGEECDHFVGGHATFARHLDGLGGRVVGTRYTGCRTEVSVGVNDDERCGTIDDGISGIAARGE